jgi:hypothetical protein
MYPPKPKQAIALADGNESPAPSLRRVVRKSALLNLVIILISCPVLLIVGGKKAVYPTVAAMVSTAV